MLSKCILTYTYFFAQMLTPSLNPTLEVYGKIHNFQYGKRLTRHSEQFCVGQLQRESLPPSLSLSRSTLLLPPASLSFSCGKAKHHRCNGMKNEAVPWPSKHFLCLAQVFSSFTPTSCEAENKKQNWETKAPEFLTKPHYSFHISNNIFTSLH